MVPPWGSLQQVLQSTLQQLLAAEAGGVNSVTVAMMQAETTTSSTAHLIVLVIPLTSWAPSLPRARDQFDRERSNWFRRHQAPPWAGARNKGRAHMICDVESTHLACLTSTASADAFLLKLLR